VPACRHPAVPTTPACCLNSWSPLLAETSFLVCVCVCVLDKGSLYVAQAGHELSNLLPPTPTPQVLELLVGTTVPCSHLNTAILMGNTDSLTCVSWLLLKLILSSRVWSPRDASYKHLLSPLLILQLSQPLGFTERAAMAQRRRDVAVPCSREVHGLDLACWSLSCPHLGSCGVFGAALGTDLCL
jgi:hypothetical protein